MTNINPIVITIIIATATFILSIFGALQFYSSRMEKYIDAKIEGLRGEMRAEFGAVRGDLKAQSDRIERIERQLESLFVPKR